MTHLKYCVCFSLCITAVYVCFCYDAGVCIYHCCLNHITVCLITFCLCSCRFCVMMKVLLITSWTPCCKRQMACHSPALLSGSLHPLTAESVTTPPLTTWTARRCRPPAHCLTRSSSLSILIFFLSSRTHLSQTQSLISPLIWVRMHSSNRY